MRDDMIRTHPIQIGGVEARRVHIERDGTVLSWRAFATQLREDAALRQHLHRSMASNPFDFMWKPVPIHPATVDGPFFSIRYPSRFSASDARAFHDQIRHLTADEPVAVFPNLSGRSQLVAPRDEGAFGHIASFCRHARPQLADAFWRHVGTLASRLIEADQVSWCNTHGHGVPWLHVRFDPTLKYAAFPPHGRIDMDSQNYWFKQYFSPHIGALHP